MGAGRRCSVGILQPERGPWRSIRVSLLGWAENTRTLFSGGPAYPLTLSFLLRGCPILTPPGSVTNPRPIRSSARSSDRRRSPGSASYPRSLHQPCTQARLALLWGPHASSLPPSLSPTLSSQLREQVDSTTVQPGASGGLPPPMSVHLSEAAVLGHQLPEMAASRSLGFRSHSIASRPSSLFLKLEPNKVGGQAGEPRPEEARQKGQKSRPLAPLLGPGVQLREGRRRGRKEVV